MARVICCHPYWWFIVVLDTWLRFIFSWPPVPPHLRDSFQKSTSHLMAGHVRTTTKSEKWRMTTWGMPQDKRTSGPFLVLLKGRNEKAFASVSSLHRSPSWCRVDYVWDKNLMRGSNVDNLELERRMIVSRYAWCKFQTWSIKKTKSQNHASTVHFLKEFGTRWTPDSQQPTAVHQLSSALLGPELPSPQVNWSVYYMVVP